MDKPSIHVRGKVGRRIGLQGLWLTRNTALFSEVEWDWSSLADEAYIFYTYDEPAEWARDDARKKADELNAATPGLGAFPMTASDLQKTAERRMSNVAIAVANAEASAREYEAQARAEAASMASLKPVERKRKPIGERVAIARRSARTRARKIRHIEPEEAFEINERSHLA